MAAGPEPGAPAIGRFDSAGPEETERLGARLAADLTPGDLVLVRGEMGAGKTTLVRGAARALGVLGPVTSPTFSIGHRYRGGAVGVSHLDLYRLGSLDEEDPALLSDYLGPEWITFVEWPEHGATELARAHLSVTLRHAGGDRRTIEVRRGPDPDSVQGGEGGRW